MTASARIQTTKCQIERKLIFQQPVKHLRSVFYCHPVTS